MRKIVKRIGATMTAAIIVALTALAVLRAQTSFQFYGPISRVITPNGDGLNDYAIFCFVNPADSGVTGNIYSLWGTLIAHTTAPNPALAGCPQQGGLNPQSVTWDGRMNGRTATSGVYLYQITVEGRSYTGTILVVR